MYADITQSCSNNVKRLVKEYKGGVLSLNDAIRLVRKECLVHYGAAIYASSVPEIYGKL